MQTFSRRHFLVGSIAAASLSSFSSSANSSIAVNAKPAQSAQGLASNEKYWASVAAQYDVKDDIINVENGNWGIMAKPVMQTYFEHTARVNRDNSYFSRKEYWSELQPIWQSIAARLRAKPAEIGLTRGATEALQNLIGNYRHLNKGDAVMYSDLDYNAIQAAMDAKASEAGAEVITLSLPEPGDENAIFATYSTAFAQHPNCKLLLLTHLSHRSGLILPIKKIVAEARRHNIDVIVDAAHSWGQVTLDVEDLGADFVGFNMHKWMGAPLGVGIMYIREDRLDAIAPNMSAGKNQQQSIWGKMHTGTSNFAAFLSVPDTLAFHDEIGGEEKMHRLRYLRKIWVDDVKARDDITILTPDSPASHAGITSFRIKGRTTSKQNQQVANYLLEKHRVFTVHRDGMAAGSCVRITPSFYNSADDMVKVANAITDAAQYFTA